MGGNTTKTDRRMLGERPVGKPNFPKAPHVKGFPNDHSQAYRDHRRPPEDHQAFPANGFIDPPGESEGSGSGRTNDQAKNAVRRNSPPIRYPDRRVFRRGKLDIEG